MFERKETAQRDCRTSTKFHRVQLIVRYFEAISTEGRRLLERPKVTFALRETSPSFIRNIRQARTFVFVRGLKDCSIAKLLESANRLRGQRTADCFLSRAPAGLAFNLITSAPSPPSRVTLSTFLITPRIRSSFPPLFSALLSSALLRSAYILIFTFAFSLSRSHTHRQCTHLSTRFPFSSHPLPRRVKLRARN